MNRLSSTFATARFCQLSKSAATFRRFSSVFDQNQAIAQEASLTYVGGFGDRSILVNHTLVRQSVICLNSTFLMWTPKTFEDITIESLSLFTILHPTIELLLIGCGETLPGQLPFEIINHFKDKGIVIEASNTSNAASTFNLLNAEGRNVAAALLTNLPWTGVAPTAAELEAQE